MLEGLSERAGPLCFHSELRTRWPVLSPEWTSACWRACPKGQALFVFTLDSGLSTQDSLASSLLPTTVRLMPTWTVTFCPFTSTTVFLFRYQPSEPVENSRGSASIGVPLIEISTALAPSRNCWRVIGQ